jgi:hypothetical protein
MSTVPSVPIINIKPKASQNQLEFYWRTPASTGTNGFTPPNVPGLQVWIDANDNTTLTVINGNDVREVRDKVNSTVFTPIQDVNAHTLQLQTNQINGLQALWFNNQFADNVYLQGTLNMPLSGSAFIVFTAQAQLTPAWRGIFGSNTANTPSFTYLNGQNNIVAPCVSYNDIPGSPTNTLVPGTTYLMYIAWQESNTSVGLFGATPTPGNNPITVTQTGTILRLGTDTGSCTNMNLGEFLIFNSTLTNFQRQQMEGYLAWKWGLNSQLPTNHPYWTNDPRSGIAPLQGYTLGCAALNFQSTYSASTNYALVSSNTIQTATDYTFGITSFNLNGSSLTKLYQITQEGLLNTGVTNVQASTTSLSSVNVSWNFNQNAGEAINKWFIITAIPSSNTLSTILKTTFASERQRTISGLSSYTYTFAVQAVNNVGYSYITPSTQVTIPVGTLPPFVPSQISNMGLWLDASISSNFTFTSNSTISTWNDKSATGLNYQNFAANAPVWTFDSAYGKPSVYLNGSNSGLIPASSASPFAPTTAWTVFALHRMTTSSGVQSIWRMYNDLPRDDWVRWQSGVSVNVGGTGFGGGLTYSQFSGITCLVSDTTTASFYINGTSSGTNNRNANAQTATANFTVGCTGSTGSKASPAESLNGYFYEFVVYKQALTNNQRQVVEGYLAWKWNINTLLPVAHPFYSAAPTSSTPLT